MLKAPDVYDLCIRASGFTVRGIEMRTPGGTIEWRQDMDKNAALGVTWGPGDRDGLILYPYEQGVVNALVVLRPSDYYRVIVHTIIETVFVEGTAE